MITIYKFDISDNGKWLNVHVAVSPGLENVTIDYFSISTDGTHTDTFATSILKTYLKEAGYWDDVNDCLQSDLTEIVLKIDIDTCCMNTPFFLEMKGLDPNGEAATCAYKSVIYSATYYKYPMYKTIACLAKELDICSDAQILIDYILRYKALEANIQIFNIDKINYYYNWFIKNSPVGSTSAASTGTVRTCGCKNS